MNNGNQFISWKWIAAILTTAIMALIGGWGASLSDRVKGIETEHITGNQRLSTTEEAIRRIDTQMGRMETKLDTLLSRQGVNPLGVKEAIKLP